MNQKSAQCLNDWIESESLGVGVAELTVVDTFPIIKLLTELDLGAASIDVGKLAAKFKLEGNGRSLEQFLREELASVVGQSSANGHKGTDVVL